MPYVPTKHSNPAGLRFLLICSHSYPPFIIGLDLVKDLHVGVLGSKSAPWWNKLFFMMLRMLILPWPCFFFFFCWKSFQRKRKVKRGSRISDWHASCHICCAEGLGDRAGEGRGAEAEGVEETFVSVLSRSDNDPSCPFSCCRKCPRLAEILTAMLHHRSVWCMNVLLPTVGHSPRPLGAQRQNGTWAGSQPWVIKEAPVQLPLFSCHCLCVHSDCLLSDSLKSNTSIVYRHS